MSYPWRLPILTLTLALIAACGTYHPPLEDIPEAGGNRDARKLYLDQHPNLSQEVYQAVYEGKIVPGMNQEEVVIVTTTGDQEKDLEGLYDEVWSYYTERDTTWVFFKRQLVKATDGTAPYYRFPENQPKRVVLRFVLPQRQTMVVSLYDAQRQLLGELLHATLEPGEHELALKMLEPKDDPLPLRSSNPLRAGRHELSWNARDAEDNPIPDGLYYLRLESTDRNEFRRFALVQ